jgi:phage host-nuclease inhibitor protein Gam
MGKNKKKKSDKVSVEPVVEIPVVQSKYDIEYRGTQPMPASKEELAALLVEVGEIQSARIEKFNRYLSRLEAAERERRESIKPLDRQLEIRLAAIQAYANAHRGELVERDSKTVKLDTGTLGWRKTPPSLVVADADKLLVQLESKKLGRFIRIVKSVNRRKLLEEPEILGKLDGVSIRQTVRMFVHPASRPEIWLNEKGEIIRKHRNG